MARFSIFTHAGKYLMLTLLATIMLLPLTGYTLKVEAAYTYVNDETHSEIGWMDVETVGWAFNPNELLLKVIHQTNIPNTPNHGFVGYFYLNTDQNPATGDPDDGSDYFIWFAVYNPPGGSQCALHRYDAGSGWVHVKDLAAPTFLPGGDTVELKVPLSDIGSPTAINIYLEGGGGVVDFISAAYNYDTGEGRSITVNGNPSDWTGDTPDVIDTTGDASPPSFADATNLYTTDDGGRLYMRMDLAEPPSLSPWGGHPEEGSELGYSSEIYIDRDNNPMTGYRYRSATIDIGADYKLHSHTYIMDWGQDYMLELYMWTGTDFLVYQPATWYLYSQLGSCLELSLRKSDIFVSPEPGQRIKIWIDWLIAGNNDRVPNSGKFTATSTPTLSVGLLNFDDYRNRMGSVTPMYPSRTFYFPHFQQDVGWQTFVAIANPNDQEAEVALAFYRDDGSLLKVQHFNIPYNGKQGFTLSSLGVTGGGWIKVDSDLPVVGLLNFDDYANRMGSMSGVTPTPFVYFPHFHQDANWQTFYAIVNPSDSPAQITITFYRDSGSVAGTESLTLNARSKIGRFAISGSGWIAVQSDTPIVGMLNFDDYHNRMGTIEHAPYPPSSGLYFPHFQQDAGWQTFYAIVNPLDTSTSITVTYYREDGSIISTDTSTLGAHCKFGRFVVAGAGWIKVNTIEHPIVGMLNFDDYHNRMGSIVAATPQSSIVFPHFHQDANWQTFYAFVNLGPSSAFTSTYYRAAGSTITSTSTTVATNSKLGRFATSGTGWLIVR